MHGKWPFPSHSLPCLSMSSSAQGVVSPPSKRDDLGVAIILGLRVRFRGETAALLLQTPEHGVEQILPDLRKELAVFKVPLAKVANTAKSPALADGVDMFWPTTSKSVKLPLVYSRSTHAHCDTVSHITSRLFIPFQQAWKK